MWTRICIHCRDRTFFSEVWGLLWRSLDPNRKHVPAITSHKHAHFELLFYNVSKTKHEVTQTLSTPIHICLNGQGHTPYVASDWKLQENQFFPTCCLHGCPLYSCIVMFITILIFILSFITIVCLYLIVFVCVCVCQSLSHFLAPCSANIHFS